MSARIRPFIAALTGVILAVTAAGQQPASAARPQWTPPKPKEVAGVRVIDARAAGTNRPAGTSKRPARTTWPAAGTTRAVTGVSVRVHDRAETARAHVGGVLLSVTPTDKRSRADVRVDYSSFADAYGGDWTARLRLSVRPACALTTPAVAGCQESTPLPTVNDRATGTLTAAVPVAAGRATLLVADAPAAGDNGDYTATGLSAAGAWQVSQQSGDFSWSYDVRVPGLNAAPTPKVALSYSSGSIDGRTGATNNQASWVGDGWDFQPGFIERKYAGCGDDNPGHPTGDQCWKTDNASLTLAGHSGELIRNGSYWKLKNDDGTRIERVSGDGNRANGDNDNEYWKVTTTDGTQYFFGYHRLPGWAAGKPETNSVWTVPVYGNNAGEPCYHATFGSAWCNQAWRWSLDYVADPHGNAMAYYYGKEAGAYGRDYNASQRTAYTRGGYLDHVDYGLRSDNVYAEAAAGRVAFTTAERCLSACWSGAAWASTATAANWTDTPWDLDCAAAPCKNTQLSPSFWSARRLTKITTQLRNGASTYRDIDSWDLRQEFPSAGNNEGSPLWLAGITHNGLAGTAVADPEVTFDHGADPLPNRVDGPADNRTALNRWRIKGVRTESGGLLSVTYSPVADCVRGATPNPAGNTTRCMPAFYANPNTGDPTLDWFHKYVVTRTDLDDLVTDQPNQTTFYDYLGGAAWHYNNDEMTKPKLKTWGDWRGYGRVVVRQGAASGPQTAIEYRYLRGMDGVQVADTWGGSRADHEALQGFLLQQTTLDGPGGAEVSSTLNEPWKNGPTATRTVDGVTTNAWQTAVVSVRNRTALKSGGFRVSRVNNTYNAEGLITTAEDLGDEAVTGDETCDRTTYARNEGSWLIDRVAQAETTAGPCADAVTPATVLKRSRTFFDDRDAPFGTAPSKGDPVREEELDGWDGGTPRYLTTSTTTYDNVGRVIAVADANGVATTTDYTLADGGQVTQTVETKAGQKVTTTKEPAWDQPTHVVDANGAVTDLTYDGAGRLTASWLPGRAKATQTPSYRFGYLRRNTGGPTAVTTEALLPSGSYRTSVELYDGFLRARQSQTQSTGGGRLLTDTFYTSSGQAAWTSQPYYDATNAAPSTTLGVPQGQIPAVTEHVYDGAGRETTSVFKANGTEKWRTTTAYGGDRTTVVPPSGGVPSTTITDTHGNVTELRQYRGAAEAGGFDRTTYVYDLLNRATKVTDAGGNNWTYEYDLHGRPTRASDPDNGTTSTTYTRTGLVETTTKPLGTGTTTLGYTYDQMGRRTSVRDDSPTGALRATWVFDTLPNGIGRLTSSTRYAGGDAYTTRVDGYDAGGSPTSTSVVLPPSEANLCASTGPDPCTYTTQYAYKVNGALYQTTMPGAADLAAEKLTLGYNDIGEQTTVTSPSQIYAYAVSYDHLGQLTQRQLGAFGSRVAVTNTYDEPTRRLGNSTVLPELKPEAADITYRYDNAGDVTGISNAPAGQAADSQCFSYDYLRHLDQAWTPASGDCAAAPGALGGPAPYWQSWTVNAVGNRTQQVNHATGGDTTINYTYPAAGSARPHAVGTVTASGGATWTRTSTYDNGGNTKTRGTQALTYDREDHLTDLTDGGTANQYVYDADGNRLIRADGTGRTLYLGDTEVRYSGGARTATRYYSQGGETVAVRTAGSLSWLIGDHHGTANLSVDAGTLAVASRRTTPYGEVRGGAGSGWPAGLTRGFVGGVNDPTGLTHIGAREYDPALGTFLSPDPLMDRADPGSFNAYGYAAANPETNSDPTGTRTCSDPQDCAGDPTHGNPGWGQGSSPDSSASSPSCGGNCYRDKHPRSHPKSGDCAGKKGQSCSLTPEEEDLKRQVQDMLRKYGNNREVCVLWGLYCKSVPPDVRDYTVAWCHMVGASTCDLAKGLRESAEREFGSASPNGDAFDPEWNAKHHGAWFAYMAAAGIPEHDLMLLAVAHELDSEGDAPNYGSIDSRADMHNNITGIKLGQKTMSDYKAKHTSMSGNQGNLKSQIDFQVNKAASETRCDEFCFDLNTRPH